MSKVDDFIMANRPKESVYQIPQEYRHRSYEDTVTTSWYWEVVYTWVVRYIPRLIGLKRWSTGPGLSREEVKFEEMLIRDHYKIKDAIVDFPEPVLSLPHSYWSGNVEGDGDIFFLSEAIEEVSKFKKQLDEALIIPPREDKNSMGEYVYK